MEHTHTFAMIKPDAVRNGHIGAIIAAIEKAEFLIKAMRMTQLDNADAASFYKVHAHRPFYGECCAFIASGPVVVMALEKLNAVVDFRDAIGATDPTQAASGTIREMFGASIECNAIHGSDSDENAAIELSFFFTGQELL